MSRDVCGICWCPYDDDGRCACKPAQVLDKYSLAKIKDDEALLRQALEALEIGHEYAHECAETYHIEMRGYRQKRHDAMDAEVKQLAEAIAALKERLKGKT
jgi:hypothetical protein